MTILADLHTLTQHLYAMQFKTNAYRPATCPGCGQSGLWRHGVYHRKSDRTSTADQNLNPVPIGRFLCPRCQRTCSALPECIAPRRWYLWDIQQIALALMIKGQSLCQVCTQTSVCRATLRRWRTWLQESFATHAFCLRERCPELGKFTDFNAFWLACLARMPLARAMLWLHQAGIRIP